MSFQSRLDAVGHNPHPVSAVRGVDGASWNNERRRDFVAPATFLLCAVAFQFRKQIVEDHSRLKRSDPTNVLKQEPSWSNVSDEAKSFRPEPAVIQLASSLPGRTGRLAGYSAADEVDVTEFISVDIIYVLHTFNVGPMMCKYVTAERVDLYLAYAGHSRCFKPYVEAADTGEEGKESHAIGFLPR